MVLSHVINGETHVATGSTVTSTNDGSYTAKENIGLMAEGLRIQLHQHLLLWDEADFEAVNHGTIDFSAAEKSTAMFINSARAKMMVLLKLVKTQQPSMVSITKILENMKVLLYLQILIS